VTYVEILKLAIQDTYILIPNFLFLITQY